MTKIINNYHFFYKARSPLTNWWMEDFEVPMIDKNGKYISLKFNCSEKYMMYMKAVHFGDFTTALEILKKEKPSEQKALGREVKGFDNAIWERDREFIVYNVLKDKFTYSSNKTKNYLKNTAGYTLVEASPKDLIWGIGMLEDDPGVEDETNWKGLNLLGKLLTKVRIDLYGI